MVTLRHAIWAVALIVSIAAVSKYSTDFYIEESKQAAFMMKACVDAGGQWVKNLGPTWNCSRPTTGAP